MWRRLVCDAICHGTGAMQSSVAQIGAASAEHRAPVFAAQQVQRGARASFVEYIRDLPLAMG